MRTGANRRGFCRRGQLQIMADDLSVKDKLGWPRHETFEDAVAILEHDYAIRKAIVCVFFYVGKEHEGDASGKFFMNYLWISD